MLGVSIYFSTPFEENEEYLNRVSKYNVKYVFTSLQIPEENQVDQLNLLKKFIDLTNRLKMKLMIDISPQTFEKFGIEEEERIKFLKALDAKCVRIDYGFSMEEIKIFSENFEVILNASTIDGQFYDKGIEVGVDFSSLIACYNFYPRKDTGLDKGWLVEKNKRLKSYGLKTMMFIPGDEVKRGPVFEGLPTIENHRNQLPLLNYIECVEKLSIDEVIVGDVRISGKELEKIDFYKNHHILLLEVSYLIDLDFANIVLSNRKDVAMNVVRCVESRTVLKKGNIVPFNTIAREVGVITIDNELYGRYQGELQIVKKPLLADERVNVIGKVSENSIKLLDFIKEGTKFKFVGVEE